ncbi:alpha/beta fold hydrolase [Amycolatopsis sp. NPDC049868]|uniref:alpha/beta fold hydrolase n=1 Tax=Amycolatopsis sp. NPDC049868 TaxID=3363934 RepID=UPI0037AC3AA1
MITTSDGLRLDSARHEGGLETVVLVHGITADLDENGLFSALAPRLTEAGFTVLRFSFRGHGRSEGRPRDMTIAGELVDLRAAVGSVGGPVSVVASSFGAVSVTLSLAALPVRQLVLWQPVLDLRRTFLEPELPRALALYTDRTSLADKGFLDIEGRFQLGAALFDEFAHLDPLGAFLSSTTPALVVHGSGDEHVSHVIAREAAFARPDTSWHSLAGAGHGFGDSAEEALDVTVRWLSRVKAS